MTARPQLTDDQIEAFLRARAPAPDAGMFEAIMTNVDQLPQRRAGWLPSPAFGPAGGAAAGQLRFAVLVAVVVLLVAATVGAIAFGALVFPPSNVVPAQCPAPLNEADAVDTFVPGLSAEARAWRHGQLSPNSRELIAGVVGELPDAPMALIGVDPQTGGQCRLVTFSRGYQTIEAQTMDWSPTGDALAFAVEQHLFIWTENDLLRVWSGKSGFPKATWSPDGSSLAVWSGEDGTDLHLIFADGRPDRTFDLEPVSSPYFSGSLRWSPDGATWALGEQTQPGQGDSPVALSLVSVGSGAKVPLDLGLAQPLEIIGWLDDRTLLVFTWKYPAPPFEQSLVAVPIDAPREYTTLQVPADIASGELGGLFVSPNLKHAAFTLLFGGLRITDLPGAEPVSPARIGEGFEGWVGWEPDGERFAYQPQIPLLWIVAGDGTSTRQLGGEIILVGTDPWRPAPEGSD
jgi:hypothetical protein